MKEYLYKLGAAGADIMKNLEFCSAQPYLSGNYQVDLLLRNHNWAGGVNTGVALTYKIATEYNQAEIYQGDFWSTDGKKLDFLLSGLRDSYHHDHYSGINKTGIIPDYIVEDSNRGAYHLYENNFASSFAQKEYMLSLYLENIKTAISVNPDNEKLQSFSWLKNANSIWEINIDKLELPFLGNMGIQFIDYVTHPDDASSQINIEQSNKFAHIIKYILNAMSSVANITFKEVDKSAEINIYADNVSSYGFGNTMSDYLAGEEFDFSNGKTNHVNFNGGYKISNGSDSFENVNFNELLHVIGHLTLDHPNDANIAIREELKLGDDEEWDNDTDYGIANEYRADNGCMSAMAFTGCFYNEKRVDIILSYMPIDIQALQHMYGRNEETRAGDTTYILTNNQTFINDLSAPLFPMTIPSTMYKGTVVNNTYTTSLSEAQAIYALYDAGGVNTFDLSRASSAKIDLNEGVGHFNKVGHNLFLIAYGVHIDHVIVGGGEIGIKLNSAANTVVIPSSGAHVAIENFSENDEIILDYGSYEGDEIGCVHPYAEMGDYDTQICFV